MQKNLGVKNIIIENLKDIFVKEYTFFQCLEVTLIYEGAIFA